MLNFYQVAKNRIIITQTDPKRTTIINKLL